MAEIRAIGERRTNAELVQDLFNLQYLRWDDLILDPTYGLGRWWTLVKPLRLVGTDLDSTKSLVGDSIDFRRLPFDDDLFDAVVFDPPYKLNGVSQGYGGDEAYGVANATYISVADRHKLIVEGMSECARVTKRTLIVKCQDQVCSGRVVWQSRLLADHGESLGFRLVDMLHVVGFRPQPAGRIQKHARRDYSTALVFTKGYQ